MIIASLMMTLYHQMWWHWRHGWHPTSTNRTERMHLVFTYTYTYLPTLLDALIMHEHIRNINLAPLANILAFSHASLRLTIVLEIILGICLYLTNDIMTWHHHHHHHLYTLSVYRVHEEVDVGLGVSRVNGLPPLYHYYFYNIAYCPSIHPSTSTCP